MARRKRDLGLFLLCAALAVLASFALPALPYARFFGTLPPTLAILIATVPAAGALALLHARGWVATGPVPRPLTVALIATGFAVPTVAADALAPFPETMNVALPGALAYYPFFALVVESLFHIAPLAILLFAAKALGADPGRAGVFWLCALPVALIEPAFQTAFTEPGAPLWRTIYVAAQLSLFSATQLALLRRGGFAAAFGFRLAYYLCWHILWGTARLDLLF